MVNTAAYEHRAGHAETPAYIGPFLGTNASPCKLFFLNFDRIKPKAMPYIKL